MSKRSIFGRTRSIEREIDELLDEVSETSSGRRPAPACEQ